MAERELRLVILGDARGAERALQKLDAAAGGIGKTLAVGLAAGGVALAGLGAAALKLGGSFDAAYDTIRIGTGATGKALEGLQAEFRDVVQNVPVSFGEASTAIADLNTRLGLTDDALERSATQFLNLARITETDVAGAIATGTRVFGDWGVAAADQERVLDELFRATQASGISFDELSAKLVQFGAPLRSMGFSLEESTALLAKWEREGVNTELVLGSLRIAMGEFARQNIPMREGLDQTIARIQELGPGAEATSLAMEVFGARAGPDMAAAILEGRFAIADYLAGIEGGQDTINEAAGATDDWREKLTLLKNRALVELEPLLMTIFDGLGRFIDLIEQRVVPVLQEWWSWLDQNVIPVLRTLAEDVLGALAATLERDVIPKVEAAADIFQNVLLPAIKPVAEAIADILPPAKEFVESVLEWLAMAVNKGELKCLRI